MGYRIAYAPTRVKKHYSRRTLLTLMFFLMFLFFEKLFWLEGIFGSKQGASILKDTTAFAALEVFAEELDSGVGISAAFAEFCRHMNQVLSYGAN